MARSGQITISSAGTAQAGPSGVRGEVILKAHPDNAGNVYVGNDGSDDVDSSSGIVLAAGDALPLRALGITATGSVGLDGIYFDAANSNDIICWIAY